MALLETLEFLLDQDMASKQQALENEGIELAALLEHPEAEIRSRALAVIAQLSKHPAGKQAVLDHRADILTILTSLLENSVCLTITYADEVFQYVGYNLQPFLKELNQILYLDIVTISL